MSLIVYVDCSNGYPQPDERSLMEGDEELARLLNQELAPWIEQGHWAVVEIPYSS